jgi:hypothetical protein
MKTICLPLLFLIYVSLPTVAFAKDKNFTGTWFIDLRSKVERKQHTDCGMATFTLIQTGEKITGSHEFSTAGCGRLNEGGDNTVKGIAVGSIAILTVISGRNGAIVIGKAIRKHNLLYWQILEEIKSGEPKGDSPLILSKGILAKTLK